MKYLHLKLWKISGKPCSVALFKKKIARLQSTVCYRTKTSTTNTFLKLLRKERMFSNFEKLIENMFFYRFKSRIFDFNKNGIPAKYFLLVFWKVAIIKPFNRLTGLLSRITSLKNSRHYTFSRDVRKNCSFESFGTFPENILQQR